MLAVITPFKKLNICYFQYKRQKANVYIIQKTSKIKKKKPNNSILKDQGNQ